jgi:hypothetical protein
LYSGFTATYDPCSEQFVTLDLNIDPCYLEGCTPLVPCNCTYTVVWYKDGVSIGTSTGLGSGLASFTYTTLPLGGNYYAAITSECCGETLITPPEGVPTSCDPVVMGPCFICDDTKVTLMAQMVLPPDNPCPNEANCTFVWYELISGNWMQVGTGPTYMTMGGGHFLLESTCDGCVKTTPFDLLACSTNPCRRVYVEDLTGGQTLPVRIFPNPTSGDIRIEWLGGDWPKERRLTLVDTQGRVLRTLTPSDAETTVILHADDLPSGMYFIQIQSSEATYRAAKVIKE